MRRSDARSSRRAALVHSAVGGSSLSEDGDESGAPVRLCKLFPKGTPFLAPSTDLSGAAVTEDRPHQDAQYRLTAVHR